MTTIPIAILSVVLAACAAERSKPAVQAASSSPSSSGRISIDTPVVGWAGQGAQRVQSRQELVSR